jgi:hypothetical protein
MAIPRFIQLRMPLPPLKPMAQSRRGVMILEAQTHPLIMAIGIPVRIIWRIKKPTKIIKGTRVIHLSKTPFFYCSIYCFLPVICQYSNALKDLRAEFASDFDGYVDNLLAPEKRATSPSSSDIINGFSLGSDNHYNEFECV